MIKKIKKAWIIGTPYSITDLDNPQRAFGSINIKNKIKILIIDDEEFPHAAKLRNEGYDLTWLADLQDLDMASEYPIIISDIKGVRKDYDTEKGGLILVANLKNKYPFKQYAVYSANDYAIDIHNFLDGVQTIPKTTREIDQWRSYFDALLEKTADPKEIWKKLRDFLLKRDVSLLQVLELESAFVDTYLNSPDELRNFPSKKNFPNLKDDIRDIIRGVLAGLILNAMGL